MMSRPHFKITRHEFQNVKMAFRGRADTNSQAVIRKLMFQTTTLECSIIRLVQQQKLGLGDRGDRSTEFREHLSTLFQKGICCPFHLDFWCLYESKSGILSKTTYQGDLLSTDQGGLHFTDAKKIKVGFCHYLLFGQKLKISDSVQNICSCIL